MRVNIREWFFNYLWNAGSALLLALTNKMKIIMGKNSNQESKAKKVNINEEIFIKGQVYKDVLSKKDQWKKVAELYHGEFKVKQTVSKDINSFRLEIPYKNHNIVLTETDVKPLKLETEFKLNRNFEFNISWEDNLERVLIFFGKQDIKINDKEFDKKYLIQSNDSKLITDFLNYEQLKQTILSHNIYLMNLEYSKKNELHSLMIVKDRNTDKLESLIELVALEFAIIDFFIDKKIVRS